MQAGASNPPDAGGGGVSDAVGGGGGASSNGGAGESAGDAGAGGSSSCLTSAHCASGTCAATASAYLCLRESDFQCQGGEYWAGNWDGSCRPIPGLDQSCQGVCGSVYEGNRRYGLRCVGGLCRLPVLYGDSCESSEGSGSDDCEEGLTCARDRNDAESNYCAWEMELWNDCAFNRECVTGGICWETGATFPRCIPFRQLGEDCGHQVGPCDAGLYCEENDLVCAHLPSEGEDCLEAQDCWSEESDWTDDQDRLRGGCFPCADGLACVGGKCKPELRGYGEPCLDAPCEAGLICRSAAVGGLCAD